MQTISPTGRVIWITGLSGTGKSSLATELVLHLRKRTPAVVMLDGDELRDVFGAAQVNTQNHGRTGRLALAFKYAQLCNLLAKQDLTVVIATISLFHEIHAWNRKNLPGYFEIYLKVPLEELRRRDPKGIYSRFDRGELGNVAGLDLAIDEPIASDLLLEFDPALDVGMLTEEILKSF